MELDSLEVKITGTATKAINSVDTLIEHLTKLSGSLSSINGSSLTGLANGVSQLGSAMQNMNAGTADFTRLAKNITKIGSVDSVALTNTATSLEAVTKAVASISAIPQNAVQVTEFAKSLGKLGSKSIENATVNIPKLGNALNGLMTTLSRAPTVSQNVIQMTNAMANLASQGSKVGTASNSLTRSFNQTSSSTSEAKKGFGGLASAIGKFYATYFMVIRGTKQLWKSIESSMDYVETLNYFNAAFGQVADNAVEQWKTSGYDSAEAYYNSFAKRAEELTAKMSGYTVSDSGMLTATGQASLGIDPEQLMNYQSVFGQMSSSMGVTSENALILSNVLSEIGADLASVKNLDFEDVWNDMSSGLAGMSRTLDKYGVNIRNVNLQQELTNLGIEANISNLNQNEKALLRTIILLDNTRYAWGDLSSTLTQPANQLRLLEANFNNLARTIGNIFLPIVAKVLPYLNALVIVAQRAAAAIVSFLGFTDFEWGGLGGGSSSDVLSDIYDEVGDVSDGLSDATDNAKELKNTLMGFDEINKLNDDTSTSSSSSTGSGLGAADTAKLDEAFKKMAEEYQAAWDKAFAGVSNKAQELADVLEKKLEPVKKIFQDFAVGDFFAAGQDTSNLVAGILNWFADAIDKVPWFTIGQKMGDFLAGIDWTKVFKAAAQVLVQGLKGAIELYLGMLSKAPIETLLISLIAVPNLLKAIGGSGVVKSITKTYNKLNALSEATEDVVLATKLSKMGYDETADTLLSFHPKLAKVTNSFKDFRNTVKDKGLFTALNDGISNVRSNLTLFQKGLIAAAGVFAEFALVKSGFYDIAKGSDNLVASIAKIVGGATAATASLKLIGLSNPFTALIVGATAAISAFMGIKKSVHENYTDLENYRQKIDDTTKEISSSLDEIDKTWQAQSTINNIDAISKKYFELAEQTDLTAQQQEVLKTLANELVEQVPELKDAIDTETGAYKGQKEEIQKIIDKKKEEYRVKALEEAYVKLIQEEYNAKINLTDAEKSYNEVKDEYYETLGKLTVAQLKVKNGALDYVAQLPGLIAKEQELKKQMEESETTFNSAKSTWERAAERMEFTWGELSGTAQEELGKMQQNTQETSTNIENSMEQAYENSANKIREKLGIIIDDTSNTFSKMGSIGANAGSSLTNNFANNISDIPYRARDAFNEIISRVNANGIGYDTGTELMNSLAETIDNNAWRIRRALSNSFESDFSGEVLDSEGNISRTAFQIRIPRAYATGGFPEDGLFFANHSEMVGKFSNGKTAVANNEQITQGIKQAVIEGMSEVFANANIGQQNGNIVVQIDGQEVFKTTQRYANQYTAMTGQPAFNI